MQNMKKYICKWNKKTIWNRFDGLYDILLVSSWFFRSEFKAGRSERFCGYVGGIDGYCEVKALSKNEMRGIVCVCMV